MDFRASFTALLALEDLFTGDNRFIERDALSWAELPLPLMLQTTTQPGHLGAEPAGAIYYMWREGNKVFAEGDLVGEIGERAFALIEAGVLRGVSIDPDSVEGFQDEETGAVHFTNMRIRGATITPVAAFAETWISVATSKNGEAVVASAQPASESDLVGLGIDLPGAELEDATWVAPKVKLPTFSVPKINLARHTVITEEPESIVAAGAIEFASEAFKMPALDGPTMLTVSEDDRVYGHIALWDTCHMGQTRTCVKPPRSASGYKYFHTGQVDTDAGKIAVGRLTAGGGHAGLKLGHEATKAHYDDAGFSVAFVRAYEDEFGIAVAGVVNPSASQEQVTVLQSCPASGDWRMIENNYELVASLSVNLPGYPIVADGALVASGGENNGCVDFEDALAEVSALSVDFGLVESLISEVEALTA